MNETSWTGVDILNLGTPLPQCPQSSDNFLLNKSSEIFIPPFVKNDTILVSVDHEVAICILSYILISYFFTLDIFPLVILPFLSSFFLYFAFLSTRFCLPVLLVLAG